MPQTAVLGQTDNFKSIGAGSRSFGGTCGEHRNNRTKTLWRLEVYTDSKTSSEPTVRMVAKNASKRSGTCQNRFKIDGLL